MTIEADLLRAILATVARQTFPPETLAELVAKGNSGEKQFRAFNLCDGTKSQSEIANAVGLDKGSFSRTLSRWIEVGIVVRIGQGADARPLHIYPLPDAMMKVKATDD